MYYFDYSATTKTDKEVLDRFCEVSQNYFGNANSAYSFAKKCKSVIDQSSEIIADYFNILPNEIIYTSGASEANNLAIKGTAELTNKKHIITTKIEHSSVVSTLSYLQSKGYKIDFVNMTKEGTVDIEHFKSLINDDTFLVTMCGVDSELGIKQPIDEIGKILKDYDDIIFHVDITQCLGKVPINLENIDLASFSGHKIYAPKGIGALIKKNTVKLSPLIHGGKSTTVYRSGTPQNELIASLGKAIELLSGKVEDNYKKVKELNDYLRDSLKDIALFNSTEKSIPNVLNISLPNVSKQEIQDYLALREIYVSLNTACSLNNDYSKAVYELYNDMDRAKSSIRISLSYKTTKEEIDYLVENIRKFLNENN
ncbi:MAG: cysteine desulfurase [Bacilli bacterium]|nr:cysteine desulfurase [Bacilli bacterium]